MAFKYIINCDKTLTVDDPIYGTIMIPYPFSKIVLSKEMQRLGSISQNGFSQYEFKKLEKNDRLSHSVGAFYVMSLILEKLDTVLKHYNIEISQNDKDIALCSMLLHDIGHGPFSHSLEAVTNYSHEKRTTDILLGDTEIAELLANIYGQQKVKQIASFIAEINDQQEIGKDSFTKLLNNLVSHQLDADRIDYLMRDAYYVDMPSAINLFRIISCLNVVVNNNQEYELLIQRNGLSSIENVLIQRYQMYRDVYLSPISVLGDELFKALITRYRENSLLHSLPVSKYFNELACNPNLDNLSDFVMMTDDDFKKSFQVLMHNELDPIIAYLSDKNHITDYILIENNKPVDKIKTYLKDIFGPIDLSNTLSIISINTRSKLYKKEQTLNVQLGNRIADLTECTNLIRPQEVLENTYVFINPTLLRIELGLTEKEFKKYESEVNKMIAELNKKPEEFELKYIIGDNKTDDMLNEIVALFNSNGFKVVSTSKKQNNDEYFDTKELSLYQKGGSLRIRKATQDNKVKHKGTYKMPLGEGEIYSSRTEIEELLPNSSFETFRNKMHENGVPIDFEQIVKLPVLNSTTDRIDIVLEKNGIQVCLSLDNSVYTNHHLDETSVHDSMIEIEAVGDVSDRIMLNEIHDFIMKKMPNLIINKQSKYERGIKSTTQLYNQLSKKQSPVLVYKNN